MDTVSSYKENLAQYALEAMHGVDGLQLFGPDQNRGPALSFILDKVHPFDLAQFLDQMGIAIRAGHHCAQPLMKRLGVNATARASLYFYNTRQEIDFFVDALKKSILFFG